MISDHCIFSSTTSMTLMALPKNVFHIDTVQRAKDSFISRAR